MEDKIRRGGRREKMRMTTGDHKLTKRKKLPGFPIKQKKTSRSSGYGDGAAARHLFGVIHIVAGKIPGFRGILVA